MKAEKPRTPEDQAYIDDTVDEFLAEAGLPPRPRGFVWVATAETPSEIYRTLEDAAQASGVPRDPTSLLALGATLL